MQRSPTTKVRAWRYALGGLLLAFLPLTGLAMPGTMPSYSLSPTLNGLNVSYFIRQDKIKIMLYLISHEKAPVICQAEYNSGPQRERSKETSIDPDKGTAFSFTYGRNSSEVHLAFVCETPEAHAASQEKQ